MTKTKYQGPSEKKLNKYFKLALEGLDIDKKTYEKRRKKYVKEYKND